MVTNLATGQVHETVDVASIHFSQIPEATVDQLLEEGGIMHCAGALMVEHPLVVPHVLRMDGTVDNVMGLAKASVLALLLEAAGC